MGNWSRQWIGEIRSKLKNLCLGKIKASLWKAEKKKKLKKKKKTKKLKKKTIGLGVKFFATLEINISPINKEGQALIVS